MRCRCIIFAAGAIALLGHPAQAQAQEQAQRELLFEPHTFTSFDGRSHPAELGRIQVPENRARADSRQIQVAFVRLKSTAARPAAPIVFLAGGPGVPGTAMARVPVYFTLFERLRAVGDVILLDQRGLGLSTPDLLCKATATPADAFASPRRWLEVYTQKSRACAVEWRQKGADIAGYTIGASADDIEDMRRALNVPRVSLIGHSYGTSLALTMIARHPDSIERAVLAAVEGPDDVLALAQDWDASLSRISAAAASFKGSAPEINLGQLFRQALARLRQQPALVTIKDAVIGQPKAIIVGPIGLQWLVRHSMNDARNYPLFAALFQSVAAGDNSLLAGRIEPFFNGFQGRSPMANAVDCSRGWSPERAAMARQSARNAAFDNVNLQWEGAICSEIGVTRGNPSLLSRPSGDMPVLFLSGSLDGNTPPHQAEYVRWGFPRSTHVVVENSGHEMLPDRAVQAIVVDFFAGGDVSGRMAKFSPPAFMSVEEAGRASRNAR
jgi:pimeloyl-ACP methyl ester carboxylesterase